MRCLAGAGVPFVTFVREAGRTHSNVGKGSYDAGVPYGAGVAAFAADDWEDTKEILHRYCQIAGKVRMELSPFRNHWWHVTLYVTTRGA